MRPIEVAKTDFKMRKEIKIGLFTIGTLVLLYFGVNFLKGKDLFNRSRTYYAYYENVSGIQISSPIIIQGINAGTVTGIKFRPDLDNSVEIRFNIKSEYKVPDNSVVRLFSNGFIGGKALEIALGNSPSYLPDGATIQSESETSLLEVAGSELDYFKQRLYEIVNSLDLTLKSVNSILTENSGKIAGTMEGLEKGAQAFGSKGEELKAIIDNINRLTKTLADNSSKIDTTMTNLQSVSGALAEADLATTVKQLNLAIDEINKTLVAVNSPDGSIGMLMTDKALYEGLTEASQKLASLLGDIEQNPKRYVQFSLFGGDK